MGDDQVSQVLGVYLTGYPSGPAWPRPCGWLVDAGSVLASRGTFRLPVTAGAPLLRADAEVLLVGHRAQGIWL